jgi:hypothetical protein
MLFVVVSVKAHLDARAPIVISGATLYITAACRLWPGG